MCPWKISWDPAANKRNHSATDRHSTITFTPTLLGILLALEPKCTKRKKIAKELEIHLYKRILHKQQTKVREGAKEPVDGSAFKDTPWNIFQRVDTDPTGLFCFLEFASREISIAWTKGFRSHDTTMQARYKLAIVEAPVHLYKEMGANRRVG